MTLYFAYGSNMHRAAMRTRCPSALALGPARLDGYEFFIGIDGWGSVRPTAGGTVYGILWRLMPRDMAALHAYEWIDQGVYTVRYLPVRFGTRTMRAMTYVLRRRAVGRPKPGYAELCAAAARAWGLPERHASSLARWSVSRWTGSRVIGVTERGEAPG